MNYSVVKSSIEAYHATKADMYDLAIRVGEIRRKHHRHLQDKYGPLATTYTHLRPMSPPTHAPNILSLTLTGVALTWRDSSGSLPIMMYLQREMIEDYLEDNEELKIVVIKELEDSINTANPDKNLTKLRLEESEREYDALVVQRLIDKYGNVEALKELSRYLP